MHKDHGRQIGEVRAEVKEQGKLLQSIDRLAMGLTRLDEKDGTDLSCKIDTFGSRINRLSESPLKWEKIAFEILKFVAIGILGYAAAKLTGDLYQT